MSDGVFWAVAVVVALGAVALLSTMVLRPRRRHQRSWSASHHKDPATGEWVFVPASRRELWGKARLDHGA